MRTPLLFCLAVALATFGAGCSSTPQSRIKKDPAAFNAYPADVRRLIEQGQVAVGFTPDQVRLALGDPDRVITRTSSTGNADIWIYRENKSRLGFGLGLGFGGGSVGTGVGVSTSGQEYPDERVRVVFVAGRVTAVEQVSS